MKHGLPLFFLLSLLLGLADGQTVSSLTPHQQLARDIFRQLIETETTLNIGCSKASEAMAARFRAAGFSEHDVQLAGPRSQNQNLIVRYRGKGKLRPVLFFAHLDVVIANREDWSFDPFTFIEKDGYFYGRGSSDMKSEVADIVANFIRLRREGFVPNRDIILALTDHEEGGDFDGVEWLLKNRRDLIEAEFGINLEGGGGNISNGKHVVMTVQTSEKSYFDYTLEVHNKGGHSSLPVKDNAIYRMADALSRLARFSFPIRLNETTRMFFERSALRETGQTKADMLAMARLPIDTAAAKRLAASSPLYNAKMRTTCVATMLSGGHAKNALPQSVSANVNCRMLPDDTPEHVMMILRSVIADTQVTITCTTSSIMGPLSPLREDVMKAVEQITEAMWPGVTVTPNMTAGATDGTSLRAAGIPVYGVSGLFGDIDDVRAHGKDERVGVKEFYEGVEFMFRFIKALISGS
jgi:acetylornithine deacetylase/succinyl-diaminopimelate desuccinylase-like protein